MKKKQFRGIAFYLLLALIVAVGAMVLSNNTQKPDSQKYKNSDFISDLENGEVQSVVLDQNKEIPTGIATVTLTDNSVKQIYVPDIAMAEEMIKEAGVQYNISDIPTEGSPWLSILPYILIFGVSILLFIFLINQAQGGGANKAMSFTKSRAKKMTDDKKKMSFKDVAGLDEEKQELQEFVDFLKSPRKYTDLGARIPKGVLLDGPPGTGKTLLARAVAGEAGVAFYSISGSDFVEMFVGVGASRVRDLFEQAKKDSPCIVFIDEIDAVGRRRGAGLGGGHDEREQTLNQLLVEMDGFGANEGIIVMAATNRVDILDPAILRPGRFDRKVHIGRPDMKGRVEILKVHSKGKPLGDDVDLKDVARTTSGFTGADLENLMNESALIAARENKKYITQEHIKKAWVKVGIGTEKTSKVVSEKDKRLTAYHEAGHAILFQVLPDMGPVYSVSIIPTGRAGGYTMPLPKSDEMYRTKSEMEQDLIVAFGGRVAEKLICGDISTGASNDIKQASETARQMVTTFGMSDTLGPILFSDDEEVFVGRDWGHSRKYGESTAEKIDNEVKKLIDMAYTEAERLIKEHMEELHACAKLLIEKEKINRSEFEAIFGVVTPVNDTELPGVAVEPEEITVHEVKNEEKTDIE
ncbi:MAG: ftsH [Clostridiales bacterium]|jgi:cell division protease FtsH|nr:ftsH [Bacillales bacterium]MDF2820385.1 ftsH [Clostridiales bacterium]